MTDQELVKALALFNFTSGPINSSSRSLYERIYWKYLNDSNSTPKVCAFGLQLTQTPGNDMKSSDPPKVFLKKLRAHVQDPKPAIEKIPSSETQSSHPVPVPEVPEPEDVEESVILCL